MSKAETCQKIIQREVTRKLVVVGDGGCGKTCLLTTFVRNEFPEEHIPTVFDTYIKDMSVDDTNIHFILSDTAGEEDYDRLRPLSYNGVNVVIICYSIDSKDSLSNVRLKWYPEIRHFLPHAAYILVGTKLDIRNSVGKVSYESGYKMSKRIGADRFFECSAKYSLGIRVIFEEAARLSMGPRKSVLMRRCYIL